MRIDILRELQREIRRLLLAGSGLAGGDVRLKELLPSLQKSGERIAVLARVAEAIERVINADSTQNAEPLLELAKLVQAILVTPGQTAIAGEAAVPAALEFTLPTNISYRFLYPVVNALTKKGTGRLEILREAFAGGLLPDLRLLSPLIRALDDSSPDLADFAAEIIEKYGRQEQQLVALLKKGVDFKRGKGLLRRILLISRISGGKEKEFYLEMAEKGSTEVKTCVAGLLKDSPECEAVLLKLSRDRSKQVRTASLEALAYCDSEAAGQRLCELFHSQERNSGLKPLKISKAKVVTQMLVAEGEKLLLEQLKIQEKFYTISGEKDNVIIAFATVLDCMAEKQEPEIVNFLIKCFQHMHHLLKCKLRFYGNREERKIWSIGELLARNMINVGSEKAYALFEALPQPLDKCLFPYAFEAAVRVMDAQQLFEQYAPYLEKEGQAEERKAILNVLAKYSAFAPQYWLEEERSAQPVSFSWDPRWVNLLVSLDEFRLVCRLISKNDFAVAEYLRKKLRTINKIDDLIDIIRGLFQAEYPNIIIVIMYVLKEFFMKPSFFNGTFYKFGPVLLFLPPEKAGTLEKFAWQNKTVHRRIAHKVLELAQQLREKGSLGAVPAKQAFGETF